MVWSANNFRARSGVDRGLLQNVRGNIDQRRTTLGNKGRRKLCPGAIGQVKRAAVSIENAGRAFDDEAMQIVRPDRLAKRFAEAVQEIEDERFLDLDFLVRTLERADAPRCDTRGENQPARQATSSPRRRNGHMRDGQLTSPPSRDEGLVLDNRERL